MSKTRAGFLFAGSSMLVACGGGHVASSILPSRRLHITNNYTPPDAPLCQSPNQTGCIDPNSGLYVIGRTQSRFGTADDGDSMQVSWSSVADLGSFDVVGPVYKFTHTLAQCMSDNDAQLIAYAISMTNYIRANASMFASANDSLKSYIGVYLAGGATAFEVIGAIAATLSVSDWALLLAMVGLTIVIVARQMRCYAIAVATPS
jgi:hypothetical protein